MSAEALTRAGTDLDAFLKDQLHEIRRDAAEHFGAAELWVAGQMVRVARDEEQELAVTLRGSGSTLRQLADDAGLTSRQAARSKFPGTGRDALPGRTAVDVASHLEISNQTVAASYEKYGVELVVYQSEPRDLKRYFLPGDPGHSATA